MKAITAAMSILLAVWCVRPATGEPMGPPQREHRAGQVQREEWQQAGLPLVFERNEGQAGPAVKFLAGSADGRVYLTPTEVLIDLPQARRNPAASVARLEHAKVDAAPPLQTIRMQWRGANLAPIIAGGQELPAKTHYFLGREPGGWLTNVANFACARYQELYPGIDLVFYGRQKQLEYDFIVAPGSDPRAIRFGFEGADRIDLDTAGNLVVEAAGAQLLLKQPSIYQEIHHAQHLVPGRFVQRGDCELGFEIADYDPNRPLIIDPVLVYSTYLGGSSQDYGSAIAVDKDGNAYVTGFTASTNFPTLKALPSSTFSFNETAFITKFDPSGQVAYSTYLGGLDRAQTRGYGIAVDSAGSAYVTGYTLSTNFPVLNAYQPTNNAPDPAFFDFVYDKEAFVTKLSPSGSALVYSTYLGGKKDDIGYAIAVDAAGNAYVTGITSSTDFPTQAPLFPSFHGCQVDPAVSGSCTGDYPSDAFVTKLDPSGSKLVYSTYLGGILDDVGYGIAVDGGGNVYVAGQTYSPDFPTTPGAFQTEFHPDSDAFVTKLNSAGTSLGYSTLLGGQAWLEATPWTINFGRVADGQQADASLTLHNTSSHPITVLKLDLSSDVGLSGPVVQSVNPPTLPLDLAPGQQVILTLRAFGTDTGLIGEFKIAVTAVRADDPTGADPGMELDIRGVVFPTGQISTALDDPDWVSRGGYMYDGDDAAYGIAVDSSGNAYVTGATQSPSFPVLGGFQETIGNPDDRLAHDAFVTKLDSAGRAIYSSYLGGSGEDFGYGICIDGSADAYVAGSTSSTNFPMANPPRPAYDLSGGNDDAFIAKVDPAASTLAGLTYLGGSLFDRANGVAADGSGNIYVAGVTYSTNFPTVNAAQPVYGGDLVTDIGTTFRGDAFVAKLGAATPPHYIQICQLLNLPVVVSSAPLPSPNTIKVQFVRN